MIFKVLLFLRLIHGLFTIWEGNVRLHDNAYFSYSPFRLTSLIYVEKFEFENLTIVEDKQCKQTELFSVMTKKEIISCRKMINRNKDIK